MCRILATLLILLFANISNAGTNHAEQPAQSSRFLVLTDIHFDPFIACHEVNTKPCPLITRLQEAPVSQWASILAEYDTVSPQYRQDTNYPLLKSSLDAAKKAVADHNAKFILILGDFLGHNYREYFKKYAQNDHAADYHAFVKKTMEFLSLEFAQAFPTKDVYAVVGNNDSYHEDYESTPHGKFFQDAAAFWSNLLKNPVNRNVMLHDFPVAGYYAVDAPGEPALRLIVLNSVLFSYKALGKGVPEAAKQELSWLHNELATVKSKHQKALILMHIPTGIDVYATLRVHLFTLVELWSPEYTRQFRQELQEFAPNIMGILAGHLHSDWFQIQTFPGTTAEIPSIGTPAISPIFGNNPGFKIYSYASESMQLNDFVTYYYPMSNHDNSDWRVEYNFAQVYQPNCQECPMTGGMKELHRSGWLANHYKWFYAVSTNTQPITEHWDPYYWCAIQGIVAADYKNCVAA